MRDGLQQKKDCREVDILSRALALWRLGSRGAWADDSLQAQLSGLSSSATTSFLNSQLRAEGREEGRGERSYKP